MRSLDEIERKARHLLALAEGDVEQQSEDVLELCAALRLAELRLRIVENAIVAWEDGSPVNFALGSIRRAVRDQP